MTGLLYDFDQQDIVIKGGRFVTANVDNQTVALVAVSQVCALTKPQLGAQLTARLANRRTVNTSSAIADAIQQAQEDGATDVSIQFIDNELLNFEGKYAG